MCKNKRIVFMGTPEIAAYVLEGLIQNGFNIIAVVSQEDKPVGRKKILKEVPTKAIAKKYNLPVYQPHKIRLDYEFMKELQPDLILTCAYGQIVPQGLLDIPLLGCLNLHGSLLPKYRGASPIQQALIHGDKVSGVTLMEMIDKMDAGRMYYKKEVIVDENDNYSSLYQKICQCALAVALEGLPLYLEGKLSGEEQKEELVTKCSKITKEEEHLSLDYSKEEFVNWVRGLSYEPGGYLLLDDQVFKILKAHVYSSSTSSQIGEIVKADKTGLILQLKDGTVSLDEVQKQGKNRMDYRSFINGNQNLVGKILK
ncbi:MAG: methionyl-tRNA formyltransferase [Bacilli bacterium]